MTGLVLPPITTYLCSVSLNAIPKLVVIVSENYTLMYMACGSYIKWIYAYGYSSYVQLLYQLQESMYIRKCMYIYSYVFIVAEVYTP